MGISQCFGFGLILIDALKVASMAPHYLYDDITMQKEVSSRNTSNFDENDVHIPYANSAFSSNAFTVRGPIIWKSS